MPSLRYNLRNLTAIAGVVLTFVALAAGHASVASGDYRWTLRLALASAAVAEYCWARLLWPGGRAARAAFVVLSLPNVFVLGEIALRARSLLGR